MVVVPQIHHSHNSPIDATIGMQLINYKNFFTKWSNGKHIWWFCMLS